MDEKTTFPNFIARISFSFLFLLLFVQFSIIQAQPSGVNDPDGMFFKARELAFEGKLNESREICDQLLSAHPGYHDVKILMGRTFAWEGNFPRANDLFREVLTAQPGNSDALFALIDLQMWYGDYNEAVKYLSTALTQDPTNAHLMYQKAFALNETGEELAAVVLLNQLLDADPTNEQAKELLQVIKSNRLLNFIGVGYRGMYFLESDPYKKPWHLFYGELGRRTRRLGTVIFRTNYAMRPDIDVTSLQIEADAYPTVRPGTYLYLNAGYSPDKKLFPSTRFGFEVFQALPKAWEISAGFRILNFDESESLAIQKDLLIVTGSVSKYFRKYYFSFRPYYTFSSDENDPNSTSLFLTARRFFTSNDHHLSLILGRGFSSDFDRLTAGQVYDLSGTALEARLQYQQKLSSRFLMRAGAGYLWYNDNVVNGNPFVFEGALFYRF
jgi:YaiO family outer membrane protein